jgi:hypothetical protein
MENFYTPHYTKKTGGLLNHQMLAPKLLGRHPADQQERWWAAELISGI